MSDYSVDYRVVFEDDSEWHCRVADSDGSGSALAAKDAPEWTRLGFHQCAHCPLAERESAYCPYARALVDVDRAIAHRPSYEPVRVTVLARGREVRAETTLQAAMASVMGLIGAFSGCPVTARLRPMARYHLPLSAPDETLVRVLGSFLVGQFVRQQHGQAADWALDSLKALYDELRVLNRGMSSRLRASQQEDSGVNSIVLLDLMAADVGFALDQYEGELDASFREFLEADHGPGDEPGGSGVH